MNEHKFIKGDDKIALVGVENCIISKAGDIIKRQRVYKRTNLKF
jgi:hypothetical protein